MKKYLLSSFAIVIAIGMSAFTKPVSQKNTQDWFKLVGTDDTVASSYQLETEEEPCSDPSGNRCGVYAIPSSNPDQPDFSQVHTFTLKQ